MLSQLLSDAVVFGFIYTTNSKPASRNGFLRTKLQCLHSYMSDTKCCWPQSYS